MDDIINKFGLIESILIFPKLTTKFLIYSIVKTKSK